jgi:hypothetical protein
VQIQKFSSSWRYPPAAGICLVVLWIWQRSQNDALAVRAIGRSAQKTSAAELDAATSG